MKIGLVEDSTTMVSIWGEFLKGCEYRYEFFGSSAQNIERMSEFEPDVIVCPGIPRYQSLSEITAFVKTAPELRKSLLVLCTSLEEPKDCTKSNFELIDHLLVKPFSRSQVLALLEELNTRISLHKRGSLLAVIVDDSEIARRILTREMESLGFVVRAAEDASSGLALIRRDLPDVVLVDLEMPGKSGFELCADLSVEPRTARLPVIVVSEAIRDKEIRRGFQCGVVDFLSKPVDSAQLANSVNSILGRSRHPRRGRALVLEENLTTSFLLVKLFEEMSIGANVCRSLHEFRIYLSISVPDILFLNLPLQDACAQEICQELRESDCMRTVPIVVTSDSSERTELIGCLKQGANDFMVQPFSKEEFQARVNNLLKIKELQDELIQKNRVLEMLAYHDPLTGLLNRRYFEEGLKREIDRSRRSHEPLGFILVDLDHFKVVNDTYGHEVGDQVLREMAALVMKNLRSFDLPCRYGGEEICLILPGCSLANAVKIAERLRANCESMTFTKHCIRQTLSIGVTAYPSPSPGSRLISDADAALYRAKKEGRNRVLVKGRGNDIFSPGVAREPIEF